MKPRNLLNRKFGWLTVIERAPSSRDPKKPTKKKYARWRCKCTCGEIVEVRGQHLRSGAVKACARNNHRWKYPPALEIHKAEPDA